MAFPPADWVAHHAVTRPAQTVIQSVDNGEARTWRELDQRVGGLAQGLLAELGLVKGDRIVTLSGSDLRFFELQFACMRSGVILAPLNLRLTIPELVQQCEILRPRAIVTDTAWEEKALELKAAAGIGKLLSWGTGAGSDFDALADQDRRLKAGVDTRPEDVVLITFTSGTTGMPKGVTTTLGSMMWQAMNQVEYARVAEEGSHVLSPLPLFHAGGLHSLSNPVMFFGGKVSLAHRFDPAGCARLMGDPANGITHIVLVPPMYQMIADTPEFQQGDYSRLRGMLVAGGKVSDGLRRAYADKGLHFTSQYGATETGPTVTALNVDRHDKLAAGSCGQKAPHVDIRLVNAEGNDAEEGEIWVRGPAITTAYFGRDSAADFTDGWFRTGDVARVDEEGFYYIVGRTKEVYKSGGENVFPFEVEAALGDHPDIAEISIIGIPHERWGEAGLAVVVPKPGRAPTLDSIRAFCDGRLARYKHPLALELVEELPRTPSNKVAKAELRERFGGTASA